MLVEAQQAITETWWIFLPWLSLRYLKANCTKSVCFGVFGMIWCLLEWPTPIFQKLKLVTGAGGNTNACISIYFYQKIATNFSGIS